MLNLKQVTIPILVRVKPGALDRIGIYARRHGFMRGVLMCSQGLQAELMAQIDNALSCEGIIVEQRLLDSDPHLQQCFVS